jgi:hypothetical protein
MWWWQDDLRRMRYICRNCCCLRKISTVDCEAVNSGREEPRIQRTGGAVRCHQTPLRYQQIFHDQNSSSHLQQTKLPRSVPACQPRLQHSEVQDPRKDLWSRKITITMHAKRVSKHRRGSAIKFCTHRIRKTVFTVQLSGGLQHCRSTLQPVRLAQARKRCCMADHQQYIHVNLEVLGLNHWTRLGTGLVVGGRDR